MKALVFEKGELRVNGIPAPPHLKDEVLEMVDGDFPLDKAIEAFELAQKSGMMKGLITP